MPISLVDLLPTARRTATVDICGTGVDCFPLTLGQIADLVMRFPELAALFDDESETVPDTAMLVRTLAPKAIGILIAAGTGNAGDPDQEAAATALPADVQLNLLDAIIRLTSPAGLLPFVERITGLLGGNPQDLVTAVRGNPVPNGAADGSGKDLSIPSPSLSPN